MRITLRWPALLKKLFITLAVLIAGAYLVLCGYFYNRQEQVLFMPRETLPADFVFTFEAPFEEVTWNAEGARLQGLYFHAEKPRGVVLFWHGRGGSVRIWGELADKFLRRGYDVLMPEYRGYGKSTGQITSQAAWLNDADLVYAYLLERYPEEQIVLYGQSLGTGVAAYQAAVHRPRVLVLETPYYSGLDMCRHLFPFIPCGLLKYPLRSDQWVQAAQCPVYLIQGTADEVIPYDSSVRLQALIPERGRLVTIEGGHHTDLGRYPQYQAALDAVLGAAP